MLRRNGPVVKRLLKISWHYVRRPTQAGFPWHQRVLRAFNYIYDCVGATACCVVPCHRLSVFCLPILLYWLGALRISTANLRTLQST